MGFRHTCRHCRGRGLESFNNGPHNTCNVCNGVTYIILHGEQVEWQECPPCKGNGFRHIGNQMIGTCDTCRGVGKLLKPQ